MAFNLYLETSCAWKPVLLHGIVTELEHRESPHPSMRDSVLAQLCSANFGPTGHSPDKSPSKLVAKKG
jgi:hypothetical protein